MNTLKKIFAVASAAATMGVMSFATISADAANIAYNGPTGNNPLVASDNGATVRYNIYNDWTVAANKVYDIDPAQSVIDYIEVDFTISGLNGKSCNVNEDGTDADAYTVSLYGTIGSDVFWGNTDDTVTPGVVNITGDGQYTVRTTLSQPADTILCLLLDSNINFYQLGENVTGIADSGVSVKIDAIRTGDASGSGDNTGDGSTTTTTSGSGDSSTTTTTTTKGNGGSSSNKNNSSSNKSNSSSSSNSTTSTVTQTADAGVVAIVVGAAAAASLAVGAMTFSKKRK